MAISRLTQLGISGVPYLAPVEVNLSTANWGWTAYPIEVLFEQSATSRLTQLGISGIPYTPGAAGETVVLTKADWGWTAYPITVPGENFLLGPANWGWAPNSVVVCSRDNFGYAYSFNENVWPGCVHNEYVFGPRTATEIDLSVANWGWQPFPLNISFEDPIDVDLQVANWGWTGLPLAVSYGTDVHLQVASYGWQPHPITVEIVYDIDLQVANWGWTSIPIGISYSYDIGLTIASYGWQPFPLDIQAPSFDITLRKADWGWQSFPIQVRQTSLLEGDIEAIAEAVYAKLQAEGAVQQWVETWRRGACDPAHPQTIRHPDNGGNVEVGGMTIEQTETPEGDVIQTRQ